MAKKTSEGNITSLPDAKEAKTIAFNKEHYGEMIHNNRMRAGLSQQQLASMIGVQKNYVTHWEAGRARPDLNIIPALCDALKISVSAFFGLPGTHKELSIDETQLVKDYRKVSARDRFLIRSTLDKMLELSEAELWDHCRISYIPIMHNYQQAAAGSGVALDEATEQYQTFIKKSALAERADEIVTVNGSSMEPMFHHGQDVFIEHTNELSIGEIGLFVVNGDGFIKEWAKDRLHSLNPEYPDIILHDEDNIRCVGRVLGTVDKQDYPSSEEVVILQELMREKAFSDAD